PVSLAKIECKSLVERWQRVKQHSWVVIETHPNLVLYRWATPANLISLPERSDFSDDCLFVLCGITLRQWQTVQLFKLIRDTLSFEENRTSRNLGGMSSENQRDFDLRQPFPRGLISDAGLAHPAKRTEKRPGLGNQFCRTLRRAAAAFS